MGEEAKPRRTLIHSGAELALKCKCGHSAGTHNTGKLKYHRNGSYWACLRAGCDCQIFETVEQWAQRMAEACPHCGGTGRATFADSKAQEAE